MKPSILIVDDEPGVRTALSGVLRDEGYDVEAVSSGEDCLERVTRAAFDLIVLDVWLPGMDGLATLARLRERQVDAQIVLISGHGNIESAVKAIKMGAYDFVEKPLKRMTIVKSVRKAAERQRLVAENRSLKNEIKLLTRREIVGSAPAWRRVVDVATQAAPSLATVLVLGESGTG
ncbi:MAG TPA: response regulator, partial [Vicinamibacterales bacterium]|nr:response regulator [Vicinamibacterales bacterium]